MKSLATTMWLSVIGIASAQAATPSVCSSVFCLHGAPAPSIGAGVPVALAAGAVLCGMMLVKLWRQS